MRDLKFVNRRWLAQIFADTLFAYFGKCNCGFKISNLFGQKIEWIRRVRLKICSFGIWKITELQK